MEITSEIFEAYLQCKRKAFLKIRGELGIKSEYEIMRTEEQKAYVLSALNRNYTYRFIDLFQNPDALGSILHRGKEIVANVSIRSQEVSSHCDALEKNPGRSKLGMFYYEPILFIPREKLSIGHKLLATLNGLAIGDLQGKIPEQGKIIYGAEFKTQKIKIDKYVSAVKKIIQDLDGFENNEALPKLHLNDHCKICEYKNLCRANAVEKDDLSLLSGINEKEVAKQNNKGIFTVAQYSYTFRPRRRRKEAKNYKAQNLFELRALAIRENKIHIYEVPTLPTSNCRIYFDIEGDPERDFNYLIGMIAEENGIEQRHSFWANNGNEEELIANHFLATLKNYSNPSLFHYGSYETKFLKKIRSKADEKSGCLIDIIFQNSINVLSLLYSKVYFPTYSNELKDIGNYLGLKWTSENASGIQSIIWRKKWEANKSEEWKEKLLTYNLEDCLALKKITEVLHVISAGKESSKSVNNVTNFVYTDNLKAVSPRKFGKVDFVSSDLNYINQCAYFDYQRNKVFVRTNKTLRKIKSIQKRRRNRSHRVNEKNDLTTPPRCPACQCKKVYRHQYYFKKVFDLKFSNSGIKRWVTAFRKARFTCAKCKKCFSHENFRQRSKYGHGLMSWIVYHNIAINQPFTKIAEALSTLFGLPFGGQTVVHRFKKYAAKYYESTYRQIIEAIISGNIIHVDETKVNVQGSIGYVWIFTNMEEVAFVFTPTREGEFLKEFLKNFKGVLISDFYAVYDSIGCPQQKCLIHLIRDLNDDLLKNPFNEEFKDMVSGFSVLLKEIVGTIDKYGLKKRNLNKHKKPVTVYFDTILNKDYESEIVKKYQTRLEKNRDKLFTFLNYNGVPWNNNNAEHGIKHFAAYRKIADGQFTESGIKQYLTLLSIYQTCKYKGIDFLHFLLSKSTHLPLNDENICKKTDEIKRIRNG